MAIDRDTLRKQLEAMTDTELAREYCGDDFRSFMIECIIEAEDEDETDEEEA